MRKQATISQIGMDVHRTFSIASARQSSGRVAWRQRLEHADRQQLREELSQWSKGTPVILEGTFGWGWISDELLAAGLDPHLSSSRKVAAWRGAQGLAKSNKIDADVLGELWDHKPVMRGGELRRWWEVWLAPQDVRDQRELLRHRMGLVRMQTAMKNQIHATLHRHGILAQDPQSGKAFTDLFGSKGRRWLWLLCEDEHRLRLTSRRVLKDKLILLDGLRATIARATRLFRVSVNESEMARRLTSLPGVSVVLGYTMAAEIGRIERFRHARSLIQYSMLAPQSDDSGEQRDGKPIGRHIGHAGRQTLQWAFIEAARGAVIKDPRFRAIFNRRTDNGKTDRGRGYITVANAMCRTAHAMLRNGADYQEIPPPRPGSKEAKIVDSTSTLVVESSRPGTGQPLAALAARVE